MVLDSLGNALCYFGLARQIHKNTSKAMHILQYPSIAIPKNPAGPAQVPPICRRMIKIWSKRHDGISLREFASVGKINLDRRRGSGGSSDGRREGGGAELRGLERCYVEELEKAGELDAKMLFFSVFLSGPVVAGFVKL